MFYMINSCKITNYDFVCLATLASMQRDLLSKDIGLIFLIVKKLLKLVFSKSNLITANRGALGGCILNRNSLDISVVEIIKAPEGTMTLKSLVDKSESSCETRNICFLGIKLKKINEIFRKFLNEIFLKNPLIYKNSSFIDDKKKFRLK